MKNETIISDKLYRAINGKNEIEYTRSYVPGIKKPVWICRFKCYFKDEDDNYYYELPNGSTVNIEINNSVGPKMFRVISDYKIIGLSDLWTDDDGE
jgi:hypothetical protein